MQKQKKWALNFMHGQRKQLISESSNQNQRKHWLFARGSCFTEKHYRNRIFKNDEADEKVTIEETVDPVPEKAGKWYICVGNELSEAQQSTVQHRVESAKYDSITTPTGQVLVGPFDSREDCIYARKMLIRKGVIGSIKLFN